MARKGPADYHALLDDEGTTPEPGGGAKKKPRTTPAAKKPAPTKSKPSPAAQPTSQPSDYGGDGGRDDGSETEPMGSPELDGEVTEIAAALTANFNVALSSRKSAFDAHNKGVRKLRQDATKEIEKILHRANAALDKAATERAAKTKEVLDALETTMSGGVRDLASALKGVKAARKELSDSAETWSREAAEHGEQVKSEMARCVKQSFAAAAAKKKKVRDEPILPHAVSDSIRAASRS